MGTGILVCGLNGSGKSTLGCRLAERLGFALIDREALCFPKTDTDDPYAASRTPEQVRDMLIAMLEAHPDFVLVSVRGNYGEQVERRLQCAVLVEAPRALRLQRVWLRSYRKFGSRMLPGGDLYGREQAFLDMVGSRAEGYTEDWLRSLHCPVIRADGTAPVEQAVDRVLEQLPRILPACRAAVVPKPGSFGGSRPAAKERTAPFMSCCGEKGTVQNMKNILVVVDMQTDFITGALGTPEAASIVPRVRKKLENFDGNVIFTRDTHGEDYLSTQEGRNLPVPHCIRGSEGWQIAPELSDFAQTVVDKPGFGSVELAERLRQRHLREPIGSVTLVGLCTDICVISNAMLIKAFLPEVPVLVDAACCAGVTPESHRNALAAMRACQIAVENG